MSNFDKISREEVHLSTPSFCLYSISKNPLQDSSRIKSSSALDFCKMANPRQTSRHLDLDTVKDFL